MDKPFNDLKDEDRPTLRDWFAVQYMHKDESPVFWSHLAETVAKTAYIMADAMLAARKNKRGK